MAAAGERRPDHAVRIDVDAPRRIADDAVRGIERWFVRFAHACLRLDADDLSRHGPRHGTPHAAVRVRNDAVEQADLDRLIDGFVDLSVSVDVEPGLAPA